MPRSYTLCCHSQMTELHSWLLTRSHTLGSLHFRWAFWKQLLLEAGLVEEPIPVSLGHVSFVKKLNWIVIKTYTGDPSYILLRDQFASESLLTITETVGSSVLGFPNLEMWTARRRQNLRGSMTRRSSSRKRKRFRSKMMTWWRMSMLATAATSEDSPDATASLNGSNKLLKSLKAIFPKL